MKNKKSVIGWIDDADLNLFGRKIKETGRHYYMPFFYTDKKFAQRYYNKVSRVIITIEKLNRKTINH